MFDSRRIRELEKDLDYAREKARMFESLNDLLILQHKVLQAKWNELVERVNRCGGEAFLRGGGDHHNALTTLSKREITTIIKYCHPDKHGGSEEASMLTVKLLKIREKAKE